MKPFINLDEVELKNDENGFFSSKYAEVSEKIGAQKLGYNLTDVAPGKTVCPFHSHYTNEEMFLILEGSGELRFGTEKYPIRKHDIIACPPGGKEVAHQIINTGTSNLKYLSLSTKERSEVCEYPDSNKIGVFIGDYGKMAFRGLYKIEESVDYFEREKK